MQDAVIKILAAFACLTFLGAISTLPSIGVSMLGCLVRWKESINLHSSVSLSRTRDHAVWLLVPSFILLCSEYSIYPAFGPFVLWPAVAWTSMVSVIYAIIRWLCNTLFHGKRLSGKDFKCAICCLRNFFVILVFIMTLTFCICLIFGTAHGTVRQILTWEIIVIYAIHLIRKTQIFTYYGGFLAGFSYLCTLEILPTGLLIAPLLMK